MHVCRCFRSVPAALSGQSQFGLPVDVCRIKQYCKWRAKIWVAAQLLSAGAWPGHAMIEASQSSCSMRFAGAAICRRQAVRVDAIQFDSLALCALCLLFGCGIAWFEQFYSRPNCTRTRALICLSYENTENNKIQLNYVHE